MTMPQVLEIFEYWRKHPPTHELIAAQLQFKPKLTPEEAWRQGAMGPEDFVHWVNATGGKQATPDG